MHRNFQIDTSDGRQRRPSTIAEQAVMKGRHPRGPALVNTKRGTFSRTTDCVTPPVKVVLGQQYDVDNVATPLSTEMAEQNLEADTSGMCSWMNVMYST